ncbi:MAG TPA: histidine phosphatase family protein [Vicinamibacterales bacterium]|nr:histidine phosphatase family protein [Vicinamibacterales bacterium]
MRLLLVHHGEAVGPEINPARPLSPAGRAQAERVAAAAARRGAKPVVVWHSGKLRARQTAEICWRACNALAEFSASRDLQPDDPPAWIADRLRGEPRDILIAGHFPHLPRLLAHLRGHDSSADFPPHGAVALETEDEGETWREIWRIDVLADSGRADG